MTVETQLVDLPFSGGVDEKTRAELVPPGSFATLSNLRKTKTGAYQKRFGTVALSSSLLTGGSVPACKRLAGHKDELLQTDGLNLYSWSATLGKWAKVPGLAPQLRISDQPALALQYEVQGSSLAYLNGFYVMAAVVPDNAATPTTYSGWATVIDAANGAEVLPNAIFMSGAAAGAGPGPAFMLVTVGTKVVAIYSATGTGNLYYSWIDLASAATINNGWQIVGAPLITDAFATGYAAFGACGLSTQFAVAYVNNSAGVGSNSITVRTFNASFVQQAANDVAGSVVLGVGPKAVSISGSLTDVLFVAYGFNAATLLKVVGLNPTTLATSATAATVATVTGATAWAAGVLWTGTGAGTVVANDDAVHFYARSFTVSAGAIVATGSNHLRSTNMFVDCRPFLAGGRLYCTVRPAGGAGTGFDLFVIDLTQSLADRYAALTQGYLRPAGHITPRLSFTLFSGLNGVSPGRPPTEVVAVSSTKFVLTSAVLKNATSSSLDLVTLDFADPRIDAPSVLAETLALSGAPPSYYDGARCQEIGFLHAPAIDSLTLSGTAGPTGTYHYLCTYEQIDARGQWHQSNVSNIAGPIATGGFAPIVTVRPLRVSNRAAVSGTVPGGPSPVRVALWRTGDLGTVYKRVPGWILLNDPSAVDMTFPVDTTSDANLGAVLYTQPGIPGAAQVKVTPPCLSPMIVHGDRLIGANGKDIWFTGQSVYGEGYWFADDFQFSVETGGDITALASMDGALVIFKRNAIAFVDGQGPPDNGAGGDFSPPQFMATDVGCIEHRSVALIPDGLLFQSLRGIELLTRKRTVVAGTFGSAVENTLAANPVITSAVVDEAKGVALFTCLPTEASSTGVRIVYSYIFGVWTVDPGVSGKSAIMWGQNTGTVPVLTTLQPNGLLLQESTTSYLDLGALYATTVTETAWFRAGGVAGFQLAVGAVLQAQSMSAHNLTIDVAYDNAVGYTDTHTWTDAEIAALVTTNESLQIDFSQPECTSFRLRITDAQPSVAAFGTGQGAILWGLQAEVGPNGKLLLLPEGNRK